MSKLNQKFLVAAVALGLSATAGAAQVVTNANAPFNYVHALEATGAATAAARTAQNGDLIGYSISAGDNAVLRAQGIRVTLRATGGATITALDDTKIDPAQGSVQELSTQVSNGVATFIVDAPAGNLFGTGTLFTIEEAGITFAGVPTTAGASIGLTIELSDPTTNAALDSANSSSVLTVQRATTVGFEANEGLPLINVGATPSRSSFVGGDLVADLGVVEPGLINFGTAANVEHASALGSGLTDNTDTDGKFQLAVGDEVDLVVTAANGAAFRTISPAPTAPGYNAAAGIRYVVGSGNCAPNTGTALTASATNVNQFEGTVTLDADMIADGIKICAEANGVTPIEAQTFQVSAKIDISDANGRDPAAVTGALATLAYNGVNINVGHVNPASNPSQESYLRIVNNSDLAGVVRISGRDDAGVAGDSPATFTIGPRAAVQVNSADLENGNAAKGITGGFGTGAGKWRVTVNAELPTDSLEVQNFLRNRTSNGVINTNVNNEN